MAEGDWFPARATPHPPAQTIAASAVFDFLAPAGANGFYLGADNGPLMLTFDGTTATATNGFAVDPGKGSAGLVPVTVRGKLSVFNAGAQPSKVEVAWLEREG
ncbi:MAG TPA: hypothetical protein VLI07_18875 [Candidatus Binatus sp.]|nr:hypothetical protein [Candidatus Binatus sp.]